MGRYEKGKLMQIRVTSVGEVESKGKYSQYDLSFNQDGQNKTRTMRSFDNPPVYETLMKAKPEDAFSITLKKEGNFWKWTDAKKVEGGLQDKSTGKKMASGDWETKEERAARQVLIVRQSSIASAVEFLKGDGAASPESVIEVAKEFEAYVFGKTTQTEIE